MSISGDKAAAGMVEIAAAQGSGAALARKLVGDAARYPHLTGGGRSKGATQVFDLEPLRQTLGGSWAAYGELIHGIALRILSRHLGGAYDYERHGERYVVLFTNLSEPEARERMARIAHAFTEFLFGNSTALAEPERRRGRFGFLRRRRKRGLFDKIGNKMATSFARLIAAFSRLTRANNVTLRGGGMDLSAPTAPPPEFAAPPHGTYTTLRGGAPLSSAAEKKTESNAVDPDWSASRKAPVRRGVMNANATVSKAPPRPKTPKGDVSQTEAGTGSGAEAAALRELAKRAGGTPSGNQSGTEAQPITTPGTAPPAAKPAPIAKPARPTAIAVDKLSFVHRPMWSVRTNMLAISTCYPAGRLANGELAIGEAVLPRAATLEVIEQVDRGALDHLMSVCLPGMEGGRGAIIGLPLHYETLADRERRSAYLSVCRNLSTAARKRLIFICRNIDSEPDQSALINNLMQLKPYATMLLGMLPLRAGNFALWKRAGLAGVGVDLAMASGNESELIESMQQFAQAATQQSLRPAACNLGSMSLAAAAANGGFDFIEGGMLQHQPQPTDVRPFTLEDLYLQYGVAQRARVSPARLLDGGTPT